MKADVFIPSVYKDLNKAQFSQNQQTFSNDEISKQVKETEDEGRGFLKLQSNCGMSDVKWV